jgi:diguanylate cyclase (GGDEF)-like protein
MKELFNRFQAALAGTVLLLALSLLAVFFPVQQELMKGELCNFRTAGDMYLLGLNRFVQGCIRNTDSLMCTSDERSQITAYFNGELGYAQLKRSTQLKYEAKVSGLNDCLLAVRMVDNRILNYFGNRDYLHALDLPDLVAAPMGVAVVNYNKKPLFIVHSPYKAGDRLLYCDIAVYDPSNILDELILNHYQVSIIARSNWDPGTEVTQRVFTKDNRTNFYGDILFSNGVLVLSVDNSELYKSARNSTAKSIFIITLSLSITLGLIYFFVYWPAQQLLAELRLANKKQQMQKAIVEKLSNGQKDLFKIFRYLSESWSFEEDFTVISRSLPFIIDYRNLIIAIRESKEAPSYTVKVISNDLVSHNLKSTLQGTIFEQTISSGEPFYSGNVQADVPSISRYHKEIQSMIISPIIYKNFRWGLVAIDHTEKDAYTELDLELMNMLAAHIALHLEEMDDKNKLNQEATRLRALIDMVNQAVLERDANRIAHLIVDMLKGMNFSSIAIYQTNKEGDLDLLIHYDYTGLEAEMIVFKREWLEQVTATKTMKIIEPEIGDYHRVLTPVCFGDELCGVFCLSKQQSFTNQDIEFALVVSNHLAVFWELNNLISRIEQEALIDPLTGVWNRRYMMKRIEEEDDKIKRHGGEACVAILDLGNFKLINDRFGHAAGDEVLKATADAILRTIRSIDSAGRYGGDEFIVLFPNTSMEQARKALHRLNQEISRQQPAGVDMDIFADFGIASCPLDTSSLLEAITIADARMYNNKRVRKGEELS